MTEAIKQFKISGRVQGVSFRANTQREAQRLHLRGWVKNCSDGTVETVAVGAPNSLAAFEQWLHHGPRFAVVDAVTLIDIQTNSDLTLPSPFRVIYE